MDDGEAPRTWVGGERADSLLKRGKCQEIRSSVVAASMTHEKEGAWPSRERKVVESTGKKGA